MTVDINDLRAFGHDYSCKCGCTTSNSLLSSNASYRMSSGTGIGDFMLNGGNNFNRYNAFNPKSEGRLLADKLADEKGIFNPFKKIGALSCQMDGVFYRRDNCGPKLLNFNAHQCRSGCQCNREWLY